MKVTLTVSDRLAIMSLMPKESADVADQIISRDLLYKTMVPKKSLETLKTDMFGMIEAELDVATDFELEPGEVNLLKEGYSRMKTEKKITLSNVHLCTMIRDLEVPSEKKLTVEPGGKDKV